MASTLYAVPMLDALSSALSQAWTRLGQWHFEPLVIKIGRIVEVRDVPTGRKVALEQWLAHVGSSSARAIH